MARKKKKKKEEQSAFNTIENVAVTAGIVGISASILGRHSGNLLTDGLNRAYKAANESITKFAASGFKNANIDSVRDAAKRFKKVYNDPTPMRVSIPTTGTDGLSNLFAQGQSIRSRAKGIINSYINNAAVKDLAAKYGSNDKTVDTLRTSAINTFMKKAMPTLQKFSPDELNEFTATSKNILGTNKLFDESAVQDISDEIFKLAKYYKGGKDSTYEGSLESVSKILSPKDDEDITNAFYKKTVELANSLQEKLFNIDDAEKLYGSEYRPTTKQAFFSQVMGVQQATLEDVVNKYKSDVDKDKSTATSFMDNVVKIAEILFEDGKTGDRWKKLHWSDELSVTVEHGADGGEVRTLHSFSAAKDIVRKISSYYDQTIVAKVAKTKELTHKRRSPFAVSYAGSVNPVIKALDGDMSEGLTTNNSYISIYDKMYKFDINTDEGFTEMTDLRGKIDIVNKHSAVGNGIESMFGLGNQTYQTRGPLDFYKSKNMNPLESAVSFFTKFTDDRYGRNIGLSVLNTNRTKEIKNILEQDAEEGTKLARELFDQYEKFTTIINKSDHDVTPVMARKLSNMTSGAEDKNISSLFNMLTLTDNELVDTLTTMDPKGFKSTTLAESVKALSLNPQSFLSKTTIKKSYVSGTFGGDEVVDVYKKLRSELTDEAMFRFKGAYGESASDALRSLGGDEGKKALRAYHISSINFIEERSTRDSVLTEENLAEIYTKLPQEISDYLEGNKEANEVLTDAVNDAISLIQTGFNTREAYAEQYTDTIFIKKSINPLDILRTLNDETKDTGSAVKDFVKQFIAGANNPEEITSGTFMPFYFVDRLTHSFDNLGLGFSPDAYSSTGNLVSNIFFKRVLPVAGAITAFSYYNDLMQDNFGQGADATAASVVANIDLGFRKIADTMGLTDNLKAASIYNPLISYASNEEEYQSYEERKDWYQNGYSPVRSGRWWSFGSSSEFRGGKISYFAPNYLRRATSDYYDVSVYGSNDEKWAHSFIPTPSHPLSTINAIMDPYWLENKHYNDRPYPVTGKMFDETTPWGVVLNPTVGALIKPQKRMHKDVLQGTTVDVRALIKKYNEEEKQKGQKQYVSIGAKDGIVPVNPKSSPQGYAGGGGVSGGSDYDVYYNDSDTAYYAPSGGGSSGGYASGGNTPLPVSQDPNSVAGYAVDDITVADRIQLSASSNPIAFAASTFLPMSTISELNESIKSKAYNVRGGYSSSKFSNTREPIYSDSIQFDPTAKQFDKDDFIDTRSVEDWLHDVGYSAKELGGIYGFALDIVAPPEQRYANAQAGEMTSFSNRFWDESVGGYGGDIMEIARRFFPHEDHSVTRINNIANDMPDWVPERYRYGDPYASLPKGDMRFPGKGYETLNELHPDEYGDYGAFDRFKILADIAPWSQEYKEWRDIAKQSAQDPALIEEMEEIEERTQRQSARHTFYNRNFGIETETIDAVVSDVGESSFKIHGSDKEYKLAGIELDPETPLYNIMSSGVDVKLTVDKNDMNNDSVSAIVYEQGSGMNLSKQMLSAGIGDYTKDTSIDIQAHANGFSVGQYALEQIAHAPIPYIHNKFIKTNTPLESWEEEELYGTSYSTWNHPLQGFIVPAVRKTMAMDNVTVAANVALFGLSKYLDTTDKSDVLKIGAKAAQAITNPLSFAGGMTSGLLTMNTKNVAIGADIGEAIGLAAIAYQNADNPFLSTLTGAAIGGTYGAKFFKSSTKQGAAVGAIVGLGISALKNPKFDYNNFFRDNYIPESAKDRWDMQEYFDRLKYIKYTGLFNKAADEAESKEGVDIEQIVKRMEKVQEENSKLKEKLYKDQANLMTNEMITSSDRYRIYNDIQERLDSIEASEQNVVIEGGEYTKAALAYKKAADSTIYGLDDNAGWSEILRALPKNHRDYFIEFAEVTNKKDREEIRSKVSDYEGKVLDILWNEKPKKIEDNEDFFKTHKLPNTFWAGWKPGVSLDNVQIKTIENEGLLLSDFGFYESNANEYAVQNTEGIQDYGYADSPATVRANLLASLNGAGLFNTDVSLTPSSTPGIQMFSDITRISSYKVKDTINNIIGARVMY